MGNTCCKPKVQESGGDPMSGSNQDQIQPVESSACPKCASKSKCCCPCLECDQKYENLKLETATFGMQSYWDSESLLGCVPGVVRTKSGFVDRVEAVQIEFDPEKTNYKALLSIFWKNSDTMNPQTHLYQSSIFYHSPTQKQVAEESLEEKKSKGKTIFTKILPFEDFANATSDQQKFRLQSYKPLMDELKLDSDQIIRSHVASRLNGYLGNYGNLESFEKEREDLALPPKIENLVRNFLKNKK